MSKLSYINTKALMVVLMVLCLISMPVLIRASRVNQRTLLGENLPASGHGKLEGVSVQDTALMHAEMNDETINEQSTRFLQLLEHVDYAAARTHPPTEP